LNVAPKSPFEMFVSDKLENSHDMNLRDRFVCGQARSACNRRSSRLYFSTICPQLAEKGA
jgi:hypothetical protein